MSAFKIKSNLDIGGNQLLNYCVGSYDDLENVNKGVGRKLFYTGSETEKNLRELIYDGTRWKTAAYLEDIDAITNGEGSLGTRVKALEEMLNVDDANDVINTWAEIQSFLDSVSEGTDLMDMLNAKADKTELENYLPLTGGTLMGGLTISSGNLLVRSGYTVVGSLYPKDDGESILGQGERRWKEFHTLLINGGTPIHSGNIGNYTAGRATADALGNVIASTYATKEQLNAKNSFDRIYAGVVTADVVDAENLYGELTGNAATATKLKTARKIWGKSFDGAADISGELTGVTHINSVLYISSSGNVGIGATTPAYNLHVVGTAKITNDVIIGPSDQPNGRLKIVGAAGKNVLFVADREGQEILSVHEQGAITAKGLATFNAGAYIPTGQTMRFGSGGPTMEYDADANAIKVTGNIYATGTVASGGKAQDGTSSGGNAQVYKYTLSAGTNSYEVQNVKNDVNVIVQVYEWNSNSSSWDMILTDVSVKESGITVTFGKDTEVDHMVTVC